MTTSLALGESIDDGLLFLLSSGLRDFSGMHISESSFWSSSFFIFLFSNFTGLRRRELHMCVIGKTDGFSPLAGREKQALLDIYTM
ncbi:hypothetical protein VTN00DRAFT_4521 [Thermoascus crustaceus]|uniref:uncharacterized protein n=1 Tax=Thermoascus crustaceus TaxID=5088 RepID=UPI003743D81E